MADLAALPNLSLGFGRKQHELMSRLWISEKIAFRNYYSRYDYFIITIMFLIQGSIAVVGFGYALVMVSTFGR